MGILKIVAGVVAGIVCAIVAYLVFPYLGVPNTAENIIITSVAASGLVIFGH